jgi:hypothetical protein
LIERQLGDQSSFSYGIKKVKKVKPFYGNLLVHMRNLTQFIESENALSINRSGLYLAREKKGEFICMILLRVIH